MKSTRTIGVLPRWAPGAYSADYRDQPWLFLVSFSKRWCGKRTMWTSTQTEQSELRELVWLASVVGALSLLGTGLAVALALVLVV